MSNKEKKQYLKKKKSQKLEKQKLTIDKNIIKNQIANKILNTKLTEIEALKEIFYKNNIQVPGFQHLLKFNVYRYNKKFDVIKKDDYFNFLVTLSKKNSKLLKCSFIENSTSFVNILSKKEFWVRSIDSWKSDSKNAEKQFSSLLRHLFCKYKDVPLFMDKAWFGNNIQYLEWFINLGLGINIRKCKGLLYPLSKKEAFYFIKSPQNYDIDEAFTYAIVKNLGGDERTCRNIINTQIGTNFNPDRIDFYKSVYRYFINNPFLDPVHYGPIVDYVIHQKYTIMAGTTTSLQPNLCMKNRDANTLLREVHDWHKKLGNLKDRSGKTWGSCGLNPYCKSKHNSDGSTSTYYIKELLSTGELIKEGKDLKHCVATYDRSCVEGTSSIWSLTESVEFPNFVVKNKKLVTIQVAGKTVIQARGFANSFPEDYQNNIIKEWANSNQLYFRSY